MIPRYRTQFQCRLDGAHADPDAVQKAIRTWAAGGSDHDLCENGAHELPNGDRVDVFGEIVTDDAGGSELQWALRFSRADADLPVTWVVDIGVVGANEHTTVSVAMGPELEETRERIRQRKLKPPRLVGLLLDQFDAHTGGQVLSSGVRRIDRAAQDQEFRWLTSNDRVLPVVVLSVDSYSERPLIGSDDLQRQLLGIAEVRVLTKQASFEFTNSFKTAVGSRDEARLWTVFDGAVRVYWPKLDLESAAASPYEHKLWVPRDGQLRGVSDELWDMLSWAAVHRDYEDWCDLDRLRSRHDRARLEQMDIDAAHVAEFRKVVDRLSTENDELKQQVQEANARETAARANAQEAWQYATSKDLEIANLRRIAARREDCLTIEDAIERAGTDLADTLAFANDLGVPETSESGSFWWRVFQVFDALCTLDQDGRLAGHLEVSTQLKRLLEEYELPHGGFKRGDTGLQAINPVDESKVHLRWRLHLRSGAPTETESIYWELVGKPQDGTRRFLIGRLGRHA